MSRADVHMRWDDLLFLHWRVDAAALRPLIPSELAIDEHDGSAWIALVPFRMEDARFRAVPPMPGVGSFYECNVRTYVRARARGGAEVPGVWFFSLDAERLLPVLGARWFWSLNYIHSRFQVTRDGGAIDYRLSRRRDASQRTRIRWRVGEALPESQPGSLEHFLTERYWLFTRRGGVIRGGRILHQPWPLRAATVEALDDTLLVSAGVEVSGAPIAHASQSIEVQGWNLVRMDREAPGAL